MKDFPMFTTENGIASLVLREIPYRREAYITLRDASDPEKLLEECVGFCRACGAEQIYATGHPVAERYPLHAAIVEMHGSLEVPGEETDCLFPVTEETVARWRQLCNDRLRSVDCAATQTGADEAEILQGGAYFIHRDGELLGTGWLKDNVLLLLCGCQPGAGERVLRTLLSLADGEPVSLQVASTNRRAIRLYQHMGFVPGREIRRWYHICK